VPLKVTVSTTLAVEDDKEEFTLESDAALDLDELLTVEDSGALELMELEIVIWEVESENWLLPPPPPPQAERTANAKMILDMYCNLTNNPGITCCMEKPH